VNVVDKLDGDYRLFVAGMTSPNRAWCAISKNHYLIYIQGGVSGVFTRRTGASTSQVTRPTITVHLGSGAIAMFENVELRGGLAPAASLGLSTSALLINTGSGDSNSSRLIDGEKLFNSQGQDPWTCSGAAAAGPKFHLETKRYSMNGPQQLKLFRMLLLHYNATGGNLRFDTVPGLPETGTASVAEFLASTDFQDKRVKFNKRSQYLAIRLYESPYSGDPVSGTSFGTVTMTVAAPCVVTATAHGLAAGTEIYFTTTGALPTGLVAGTHYFVKSPTTNAFNVSATSGGSAITTTGSQSGTHTLHYLTFANTTFVTIGAWAFGFKWKRPGRV
jgi:hypothetical protein